MALAHHPLQPIQEIKNVQKMFEDKTRTSLELVNVLRIPFSVETGRKCPY